MSNPLISRETVKVVDAYDSPYNEHLADDTCIAALIAALQVVVDEVVPEYRPGYPRTLDEQHRKVSAFIVRDRFQSIIDQLKYVK